MKLNWGHKLFIFTSIFMLFIIFMVYRISLQKVDLVDENYYEKGVRYQEEINKYAEGAALNPTIIYDAATQQIQFTATTTQPIAGKILLYRAADEKMDKQLPFQLNEQHQFVYSTADLNKGSWKITFEWSLDGKLMAAEKQFVIQ